MNVHGPQEKAPVGFDSQGWPLPEVRSMMIDNFTRSWRQHWLALAIIFVVSVFLVLFATWLVTPRWEAIGYVEITSTALPEANLAESAAAAELKPETMAKNMMELIKSREFLYEVIDGLKLDAYFEQRAENPGLRDRIKRGIAYVATAKFLRPPSDKINWRVKALDELQNTWLNIAPMEGTTNVPVIVLGDSPDKAKEVADAILSHLTARMDSDLRGDIERQAARTRTLLADARERLAAVEAQIEQQRVDTGIFSPAEHAAALTEGITTLERERATLAMDMSRVQRQIGFYEQQLEKFPAFIEHTRSGTMMNPGDNTAQRLEVELAQLRAERVALLERLPSNHATVRSLDAQIDSLQQSLEEAKRSEDAARTSETVIAEMDARHRTIFDSWQDASAQFAALQARQAGIDDAIAALREEQRNVVRVDAELARLRRDAQLRLDEVNLLDERLRNFELMLGDDKVYQGVLRQVSAHVANPKSADSPSMLLAGILALAIGAFAALVLPIAYDYLNQTLLSPRQATAIPGVRLVAVVPRMSEAKAFKPAR